MRPRISFLLVLSCSAAASIAAPVSAQTYAPAQARRHFVTISYDWLFTQPLRFGDHPLEDLLGTEVASAQLEDYEYRTRNGATRVDVIEFRRRGTGAGITLYPLGVSSGPALALRGSYEQLPVIRLAFDGPAPAAAYVLAGGRALDAAAGLYMADRAPGWGLGSHAFVAAGLGRITSDLGDGRRYFAEGGGGLSAGPLGVEIAIKFAWNRLSEPVDHRFMTVPVTVRGTLTF